MMPTLAAYFHTIDPYAVKLWDGGPIRWYGLSYLIGFLIAYWLIRRVSRVGISSLQPQHTMDFVITLAVGIVLGGRLGYVLFYKPQMLWSFNSSFPYWDLLAINQGGMASHGGMIGGLLTSFYYARRVRENHHSWPHLIDLIAFAAPLGLFFGRIANFINGELIGRPCSPTLPWAVKFPQEMFNWDQGQLVKLKNATIMYLPNPNTWSRSIEYQIPRFIEQIQNGNVELIRLIEPLLTPRHPSQIYQAVLEGLCLFVILTVVWAKPRKPGVIGGYFCIAYGLLRIIGEFYRQPDSHLGLQWLGLTRGQWLSTLLILAGIVLTSLATQRNTKSMGSWRKMKKTILLNNTKI